MSILLRLHRLIATALWSATVGLAVVPAVRADMVDHLDLKSDEFTKADVTRDEVLALIAEFKLRTK